MNTKKKKIENWKVILPEFLYGLGEKMWGKRYMKKWYLKNRKVLLK